MVNKKAQMKIQQMAFMLIAVTLLFALVGLFVLSIYFSGLKNSSLALEERNALLLTTKIANSPEFSCGEAYGSGNINCIDGDKVMALMQNIDNYQGFWGKRVTNIEIRKIYPQEETKLCTLGNYPNCNVLSLKSGEKGFSAENFVSLCRKDSEQGETFDRCELAKVIIKYESLADA
jgi:hypothetical protein